MGPYKFKILGHWFLNKLNIKRVFRQIKGIIFTTLMAGLLTSLLTTGLTIKHLLDYEGAVLYTINYEIIYNGYH